METGLLSSNPKSVVDEDAAWEQTSGSVSSSFAKTETTALVVSLADCSSRQRSDVPSDISSFERDGWGT